MYCPQHYIDGNTNTWIIKPISNCSGLGIILSRDLNKIKDKITVAEGFSNNYILQKYIGKTICNITTTRQQQKYITIYIYRKTSFGIYVQN